MPEALRHLPPIATGMPAAARDKLIALFDERAQYSSVVQQGRSTGDGHIRGRLPGSARRQGPLPTGGVVPAAVNEAADGRRTGRP